MLDGVLREISSCLEVLTILIACLVTANSLSVVVVFRYGALVQNTKCY